MSSPKILSLLEAREFQYSFRWGGGSCTGHALLVLNNDQVLSYLPKTKHHILILKYLETTKFKGFETTHSKTQRCFLPLNGRHPGYL